MTRWCTLSCGTPCCPTMVDSMVVQVSIAELRSRLQAAPTCGQDIWAHTGSEQQAMPEDALIGWVTPVVDYAMQHSRTSSDQFVRSRRAISLSMARVFRTILLLEANEVPADALPVVFETLMFFVISEKSITRVVAECGRYQAHLVICDQALRAYRAVVKFALRGGVDSNGKPWSLEIRDLTSMCHVCQEYLKDLGSNRSQLYLRHVFARAERESKKVETDLNNKKLLDNVLDELGRIFHSEWDDLQQLIANCMNEKALVLSRELLYRVRRFIVVALQLCNRSVRGGEFEEMTIDDIQPVWESRKFKRTKSNRYHATSDHPLSERILSILKWYVTTVLPLVARQWPQVYQRAQGRLLFNLKGERRFTSDMFCKETKVVRSLSASSPLLILCQKWFHQLMPGYSINPTGMRKLQERLGNFVPENQLENYQLAGNHQPKTVIHYAKTSALGSKLAGAKAFDQFVAAQIFKSPDGPNSKSHDVCAENQQGHLSFISLTEQHALNYTHQSSKPAADPLTGDEFDVTSDQIAIPNVSGQVTATTQLQHAGEFRHLKRRSRDCFMDITNRLSPETRSRPTTHLGNLPLL